MRDATPPETDRGQAYTLEGFIGAMVVLMAVLFALQSVVITPTTGGLADRTVQQQIQQEAQDALVVANQEGDLSTMVRYWDGDGGYEGADQSHAHIEDTYAIDDFEDEGFVLAEILNRRFSDTGWSYNVELHYQGDPDPRFLVYQSHPPSDAVTASYTVTLYQGQEVTSSESGEIDDSSNGETIPPLSGSTDPIYNVVEVRVIVW